MNKDTLRARHAAMRDNPDDPRHGTRNGYTGCLCRCERCREANRVYTRRLRRHRRHRATPAHVHGTVNGYQNYMCRCQPCTTASYAAYKGWAGR